jgi:hypothetical protein
MVTQIGTVRCDAPHKWRAMMRGKPRILKKPSENWQKNESRYQRTSFRRLPDQGVYAISSLVAGKNGAHTIKLTISRQY